MNRRFFYGLVAALMFTLLLPGLRATAESTSSLYKKAQDAEDRDDFDKAFNYYLQCFQKEPKDIRFRAGYYRTRLSAAQYHVKQGRRQREDGNDGAALAEFVRATEIDPSSEIARQEIAATRAHASKGTPPPSNGQPEEISSLSGPQHLKPVSDEPLTLHMSEDSKNIYMAVGKAAGINVLFDPDYSSKHVQVDLNRVSLYDALQIIGTVTGTFWRPVTSNTIFVAQNTRAKRTELDEQAVQTFYLTNVAQQNDFNDIQTALRNLLSNAKLYGVPSQSAIVVRGTPDELLLAEKLINDLDKARPEVIVDVAVLEVNKDKLRNIGLQLPGSIGFSLQSSTSSTTSSSSSDSSTDSSTSSLTLNTLNNLSASNFAVTLDTATANLLLTDSDTRILQSPRIRASDGQKANMKVGSRIPIATGSYSTGTSTTTVSSLVNTQFQYLDVGVEVDMTPTVHYDRDVTLKLKIVISSQSGSSTISGVTEPIISQRTVEQVIRLREGEPGILGGISDKEQLKTVSGTPGLGELPIIKYLFSSQQKEVKDDEIVFMLIPHVVRATQLSPLNLSSIDTGTGGHVQIRRTASQGTDVAAPAPQSIPSGAAPAPAVNPQPGAQMPQGPVAAIPPPPPGMTVTDATGTSAINAAGNAIAAQRQDADLPPPATQAAAGTAPQAANAVAGNAVQFALTPSRVTQPAGSTFQVAINASNAQDLFAVPLQVQYDAARLTLINVESGPLLGKDGQPVALVHRDNGTGGVTISASRPPGSKGVEGSGGVYTLTFQAKTAGDAQISITRPAAINSTQNQLPATGSQATVHVQ